MKTPPDQLTQQELKSLLHYNPSDGRFTWLNCSSPRMKNNNKAGCIANGYIVISVLGRTYLAHRLAWLYMNGTFPVDMIDHINQIRNDNRIENLRECNRSENYANCKRRSRNKSGYKGVSPHKQSGKWQAQIECNKKNYHLGLFDCKHEAAKAYNDKALQLFGEFSCLNEVNNG